MERSKDGTEGTLVDEDTDDLFGQLATTTMQMMKS